MTNEVFSISPDNVQGAVSRLQSSLTRPERLAGYVSSGLTQIERQQKLLFRFLAVMGMKVAHDNRAFSLGAVTAYDMVPARPRTIPLTRSHVDAYAHSVVEYMGPSRAFPGLEEVEAGWMLDKLQVGSPAFVEWLKSHLGQISDVRDRSDTYFGALSATVPFYLRAESQRLESTFNPKE